MSSFQLNQALFDSVLTQLRRDYHAVLERAIFAAVDKYYCGESPSPTCIAERGTIVHCRVGDDCYDEFQWDGEPQFQQRVKFSKFSDSFTDKHTVTIEITPCYPKPAGNANSSKRSPR